MKKENELIKKWFSKGYSDLKTSKIILNSQPNDLADIICFHSQQAAEKYLKGLLVFLSIEFKKTHDITYLLDLLNTKLNVPENIYDYADILADYSVIIRYPADEDINNTEEDAREAYKLAKEIKQFVQKNITTDIGEINHAGRRKKTGNTEDSQQSGKCPCSRTEQPLECNRRNHSPGSRNT